MKLLSILWILMFSFVIQFGLSQEISTKYKRSSLHLVLIESDDYLKKDIITDAYQNKAFPDNYNDHRIAEDLLEPSDYPELARMNRRANTGNARDVPHLSLKGVSTTEVFARHVEKNDGIQEMIEAYIEDHDIARGLVAKWFQRDSSGHFHMDLIQQRGDYSASALDVEVAKNTVRGVSALKDAGEELIENTFVVFTRLNFVENEPIARMVKTSAMEQASKIRNPLLARQARKAARKTYDKMKKGYSVWTTSWLYKLKWNDEIEAKFYDKYWVNESQPDPDKIKAFENSDLFELEFIGTDYSQSIVTFSLKKDRSEEELIEVATVRNIDATFAKLQRNHDVFKPKVPVLSVDPVTAKIGHKEGLEDNDKFEVLEVVYDPENGQTTYEVVDKVKVEGDEIWDNRYKASVIINEEDRKKSDDTIDKTTFSGGNNKIQPGMLLRQIH